MNRKQAIVSAVLALVGSVALAAQPADAPKTRAQVTAEYLQARASGEYRNFGEYVPNLDKAPAASHLSRAQVRNEVIEARADGSLRSFGENVQSNE